MAEMNISSHSHLYRNLHLKVIAIDHNWLIRCSQCLRPFSDFNYMMHMPSFQRANLCKKKCNLSLVKYQVRKCYHLLHILPDQLLSSVVGVTNYHGQSNRHENINYGVDTKSI